MVNFAAQTIPNISVGEAGIYALLGYAVVFFGLILLMVVVMIMGKIFVAAANRKKAADPAPVAQERRCSRNTSWPHRGSTYISALRRKA